MPDEIVDPVQPDEGQGGEDTGAAPYQEWLDRFPEEARGTAEEAFKDFDARTTRKFQEQAEAQRRWQPYEEAGVTQLTPEQIQGYRQFQDALENRPQEIQQWWNTYAQQNGLTAQEAAQQAPPADEFGTYVDPNIEDVLKQQLGPIQQELQQMSAWRQQQEQAAQQQQADQFVRSEFDRLKKDHPDFDEGLVTKLVAQYQTSDPRNAVSRAFADSQAIISQLEKRVFQQKKNDPAPAEGGGTADGSPENITTLGRAKEVALARLRESNRQ